MLTWNYRKTDELWGHDEYETEEECISDAKENYGMEVGDTIAIGTVYPYVVCIDAETVLDALEENAYEECGEVVEDWKTYSKDNKEELDNLTNELTECVNRYLLSVKEVPSFYKIDDIYTVTIK